MPDYTAHGFPSMNDSDDLGDVGVVGLELATLLESWVKLFDAGSFSLAMASVATNYDQVVVFPVGLFAAAPIPLALIPLTTVPHLVHVSITAISASQMTVRARRETGSTTPITFYWAVRG